MGCGPQEEQLSFSHKFESTWALASSESQPSAAGMASAQQLQTSSTRPSRLLFLLPSLRPHSQPHQTLQMPRIQALGMGTRESSDHICLGQPHRPGHWWSPRTQDPRIA